MAIHLLGLMIYIYLVLVYHLILLNVLVLDFVSSTTGLIVFHPYECCESPSICMDCPVNMFPFNPDGTTQKDFGKYRVQQSQ